MAQKLFDKASLVMIPSQYKEGKIYNIKPEDQSSSFEFERGSAATRVNSSGLIETLHGEATNLLLQSNNFDTTWGNDGGTITNGFEGYDGTNDAWKYTKQGEFDGVNQLVSVSGVHTVSVYVKLVEGETNVDSVLFRIDRSGGNTNVAFSLVDDLQPTVYGNGINAEKENIGNGWYRCSFTLNQSTTKVNFRPSLGTDTAGTSGSIYVQDAQLESGYFATPYIETTTEAVTRPNRHDTPRLDYSGTEPALLLEPQRTNLLLQSEYFGTDYTLSNVDYINNDTASPDGLQNATKIYPTASGNYRHIRYNALNPASGLYTFSIFAKASELDHLVLIDYDGGGVGVDYNLTTGVATDSASISFDDVDMIPYGNGWYRCIATATNPYFYWILSDNGDVSVTANGTDGLYIWGAQAEQGSYATSYIPTNGQAETRLADVCNGGGDASVFNDSEGTLYMEFSTQQDVAAAFVTISDGSITNRVGLFNQNGVELRSNIRLNNAQYNNLSGVNISDGNFHKVAVKYDGSNIKLFLDGQLKDTDPYSGTFTAPLSTIEFFQGDGVNSHFNGNVRALHYFPEALTDTELQQLTNNT